MGQDSCDTEPTTTDDPSVTEPSPSEKEAARERKREKRREKKRRERERREREQQQTTPAPEPQPEPGEDCEPGYDPCVPTYPPDLNCPDLGGPYAVTGSDPHGLDRDSDGVGCE